MVPKFEFHGIKPAFINGGLRAFVQTVLPTIYDDSLSYYELLNKVVKHLNNVVTDVATLNTNQENFIAVVTDFINRYGIETYDIKITNPLDPAQLQLSEDDATALFEAIANNKVVRVFVHNTANSTVYTCYYCTIDNSTVEPGVNKNDLYFAGYNFRQLETNATVIPWKIVKIERSGAITIYDSVNAVTKKYVDDSIQNATNAIGRRIDTVENKSPYKVYFDVYPNPENAGKYIVACDETPLALSMLDDTGRDIECYMAEKSSAAGAAIKTVKADTVVFGTNEVIISFDNMPYNANEANATIYKKGYYVIHGNTADNEWVYQLSGKVTGRVDFNIEVLANNAVNLVSYSHTPTEVYRLYQEFNGFVPCAVYFNSAITGGGETVTVHVKTNAIVHITNTQQGYLINVDFDDITNGANSLAIMHYSIQGFSETNAWNFSSFAFEYPVSNVPAASAKDNGKFLLVDNGNYYLEYPDNITQTTIEQFSAISNTAAAGAQFPYQASAGTTLELMLSGSAFASGTTYVYVLYSGDTQHTSLGVKNLNEFFAVTLARGITRIDIYSANGVQNGTVNLTVKTPSTVYRDLQTKLDMLSSLADTISNKKINFLGDSITVGGGHPFTEYIANNCNCTCRNYGVNGSTIQYSENRNPMCVRYADMDNDADIVVVMGGTNDYWNNLNLGVMGDSGNNTLYGALDTLANGLIAKYPTQFIYFVTPPHGYNTDNFTGDTKSHIGSMQDVANAIKAVAEKYSIPVLDIFNSGGLYPKIAENKAAYYNTDGVHLNATGQEHLAKKHISFILDNYRG